MVGKEKKEYKKKVGMKVMVEEEIPKRREKEMINVG